MAPEKKKQNTLSISNNLVDEILIFTCIYDWKEAENRFNYYIIFENE